MVCLVVLRCLSVRCVGRTVQLHRRLLKELPSLVLRALPSRMNEKEYSYMKDIVPCGVVSEVVLSSLLPLSLFSVHLFVRWHYAELTGDRRGYDSALAALSPELRSSWVGRRHNRGCPVL